MPPTQTDAVLASSVPVPASSVRPPASSAVPDLALVARRRLVIALEGSEHSALLRALATLHRRRFRVLWLQYAAGARAASELHLVVEGPARHAHCLEAWLGALVDVRTVQTRM